MTGAEPLPSAETNVDRGRALPLLGRDREFRILRRLAQQLVGDRNKDTQVTQLHDSSLLLRRCSDRPGTDHLHIEH